MPAPDAPPWEKWELDADFFSTLSRWTLENPKTSLNRVLDRVCNAIELGREFFELIPGGTFHARGLVLALAHLVKLGKIVSTAKPDVQAFAKEVIHWISGIMSMFKATRSRWRSGHFTRTTWKNLAGARDLIDEICKWATSRLSDRRWSLTGIKNRLVVDKEIAEFKSRMAEARAIFNERSIVSQAWGIDATLQMIRRIFDRQKQIELTLRRVHATQAEHLKHIIDRLEADEAEEARRRKAKERRQYVAQMLSKHAVANTTYDEQGKPPCDKDTRVDILKEIMGWVKDVIPGSQNFFWLTGDPGCGKSAITASIARECKDNDCLWAQFFINRSNVDTTNPDSYFPSIARQLAARSELVELEIHDRLKAKPSLMDAMSSEQATALFIDAIRVASELDPKTPVVIVIDGLDETDRSNLRSTADILSRLFDALSKHPNAKVFISSRTEDDIRNPFARTMNNECVKHLHLDIAAESSIKDVSTYLRRLIVQIVLDHDLDWRDWPGDERMDMLAMKASGLFIWAVTAAKFFRQQIDSWGTECLDDILDKLNSDGMGDINTLYGLILSFTYTDRADEWAFECFRRLIGAIVVLQEPLCLNDISRLLSLRRSSSTRQVDIIRFVRQLRTVLVTRTDSIDGRTVPRLHKSFFEFITSDDRVESRFRVNPNTSHRELGFQCIRQLALARSATTTLQIPVLFRYAFRFWSLHLLQGLGTVSGIVIANTGSPLSLAEFQSILQRSSTNERAAPIFLTLSQDKSRIQASLGSGTRAWDITSGIDETTAFTSDPASIGDHYNTAASPVVFHPSGRRVAWVSLNGDICLWDIQSSLTSRTTFDRRTQAISLIAFSPDCKRIVSGTAKGELCISDFNGQQIGGSFHGHPGMVTCAAFSSTGHLLVSGYSDGTLQLWNIQNRVPVGTPLRGHGSWVRAVTFSPDGGHALSCSDDGTIHLWDAHTNSTIRQLENLLFEGHTKGVKSVAFSPDGRLAVSGSDDQTIRFWEVRSGKQVGAPLEGHGGIVWSIGFSPNGRQIVSGSADRSICVWDVETRRLIGPPLNGHTGSVRCVAFSPDGNQICSGSGDQTIRVWTPKNSLHDGFETMITAFSPNGKQTISVSHNHSIRLWDVQTERHDDGLLLEGGVQLRSIRFITFSLDGSRITALSSDTICLWDAPTGSLLAASRVDSPSDINALYFTHENNSLVTTLNTGTTCLWKQVNRQLIKVPVLPEAPPGIEAFLPSPFFEVDQNQNLGDIVAPRDMQWFSSHSSESCLWAFIDSHIIRARKDGSVMVVPVSRKNLDTPDRIRVSPRKGPATDLMFSNALRR